MALRGSGIEALIFGNGASGDVSYTANAVLSTTIFARRLSFTKIGTGADISVFVTNNRLFATEKITIGAGVGMYGDVAAGANGSSTAGGPGGIGGIASAGGYL